LSKDSATAPQREITALEREIRIRTPDQGEIMTDTLSTRDYNGLAIPTPGTFDIDAAHTRVGFVARHLMVSKVRGSFTDVSGQITVGEDPVASGVTAIIQANSITTGVEQRDGHLRSGDFLEIEKYPTLEFHGTGLTPTGGNEFTVTGDLTIKGVTRQVELAVEFEGLVRSPWGKDVIGFTATTEIDREDYGITWNQALETGGVMVGKKIKIEIEGEAVRQD
jgi:polyisoprenoid-binding protein YceI